jgi:hypothetical protein
LRGKLALNEADDSVRRDLDAPCRARRLRGTQSATDIGLRERRGSPAHVSELSIAERSVLVTSGWHGWRRFAYEPLRARAGDHLEKAATSCHLPPQR